MSRSLVFTVRIELGNAAMRTSYDVANALTAIATRFHESGAPDVDLAPDGGKIRDLFGNTVGEWSTDFEEEVVPREASVDDAIYTSVASDLGVPLADVARVLAHREVTGDAFWALWDAAVTAAGRLYQEVVAAEREAPDA